MYLDFFLSLHTQSNQVNLAVAVEDCSRYEWVPVVHIPKAAAELSIDLSFCSPMITSFEVFPAICVRSTTFQSYYDPLPWRFVCILAGKPIINRGGPHWPNSEVRPESKCPKSAGNPKDVLRLSSWVSVDQIQRRETRGRGNLKPDLK
jgi:hypothetical protein